MRSVVLAAAMVALLGCRTYPEKPGLPEPVIVEGERRLIYVAAPAPEVRAAVSAFLRSAGFELSGDAPARTAATRWREAAPGFFVAVKAKVGDVAARIAGVEIVSYRAGSISRLVTDAEVADELRRLEEAEDRADDAPGIVSHAIVDATYSRKRAKEKHAELDRIADEAEDELRAAENAVENARYNAARRKLEAAALIDPEEALIRELESRFGLARPR